MGKVNSVNRSFMSVRQLSTAGLLVGITIFPVSYTHLDVYKRQGTYHSYEKYAF